MNLYEFNKMIEQLEKMDDAELVEFYKKKREQLLIDIQKKIRGYSITK